MGHEILKLDKPGYAIHPAWHQLGKVFDRTMTTAEVMSETSVGDYDVIQGTGFVAFDPATGLPWAEDTMPPSNFRLVKTEAMFNYRNDLKITDPNALLSPLGVGRGYEVIQNSELCDIADAVIDKSGARYEAAGTLRNGKLVWLLARWPGEFDIAGDKVRRYILIYQGHDSSAPITIAATTIRVVCWNTLSAALADEGDNCVRIKHTADAKSRIAEAIKAVQLSKESFERQQKKFTSMTQVAVNDRMIALVLASLYPNPKDSKQKNPAAAKKRDKIMTLLARQPGANGPGMRIGGELTQYALYNAITHYWQHESVDRARKNPDGSDATDTDRRENRFRQNMLGGSQETARSLALQTIMEAPELVRQAELAGSQN